MARTQAHRLAMAAAVTAAVLVGASPAGVVGIVHRSDLHAAHVACSEANDVRAGFVKFLDKQIERATKAADEVTASPTATRDEKLAAERSLASLKILTADEKADLQPKECR